FTGLTPCLSPSKACLERMRNSRDRLLNRYRQAGGNMPRRSQNTLLVQEVMEEEWSALQCVDSCPEVSTQLEELLDVTVLEENQQEMADQEWCILREYEKSLQFDEKCLSVMLAEWEANALICPVCTKSNVSVSGGVVACPCGLYLPSHVSVPLPTGVCLLEAPSLALLEPVVHVCSRRPGRLAPVAALETFTAGTPVPGLPAKFPRGKTQRVALSGGTGPERWRRRRVTPSGRFGSARGHEGLALSRQPATSPSAHPELVELAPAGLWHRPLRPNPDAHPLQPVAQSANTD
ncbi:RPA-interacting protein, partial [Leptonychotes weddellii]|uniref:RPA-interacting protein n=1 Tax=Leptonychotes weddellii TaxID=9713 RepID=A0A7F8Q912_LEPWE